MAHAETVGDDRIASAGCGALDPRLGDEKAGGDRDDQGRNLGDKAVADYDSDNKVDFSYSDGSGNWITKSPATSLAGPATGYSSESYPIETGYNLATNFSRLNLYGRCDVAPAGTRP